MAYIPGDTKGQPVGGAKTIKATYSFAVNGGAVGTIALTSDAIPSGAIVTDCFINVRTVPTSGGAATASIGVEAAADVQAAVVISGAPYSTVGAKRGSALTATAAPVVTTAARVPSIVVAVAALTAGIFDVWFTYWVPTEAPVAA